LGGTGSAEQEKLASPGVSVQLGREMNNAIRDKHIIANWAKCLGGKHFPDPPFSCP
jgi:hypothetical protein